MLNTDIIDEFLKEHMFDIPTKNKEEIKIMKEAGQMLGSILKQLQEMSQIGTDVWELEETFMQFCKKEKIRPACKNYKPFGFPPYPTGLCLSIDEQSVHCFPIKGRKFKEGDLVTIDTVIEHKGYYVDSAVSFGIGKMNDNKQKILDTTQKALEETIKKIKPGVRVGVLSSTMQKIVENEGYSVLTDYAGHGIGKKMHEPPEVPCYGKNGFGPKLKEGMILAIEPLVCEKSNELEHNNYWETKTADGGMFVQCEHTVLVTQNGYEVLTKRS